MLVKHISILRRYTILIIIILCVSSCTDTNVSASFLPSQVHLIKNADPIVMQGQQDGCKTGFEARGNSLYTTLFDFSLDPELVSNKAYWTHYYRGYIYCFVQSLKKGTVASALGSMTKHSAYIDNHGAISGPPSLESVSTGTLAFPWKSDDMDGVFPKMNSWINNGLLDRGGSILFKK